MLLERTKGGLDYPGSTSTCLLPGFYSSFGRKIIIPLFKLKESKETAYNRHTLCSVSFSQPSMIQQTSRNPRLYSCSPDSGKSQGHLFVYLLKASMVVWPGTDLPVFQVVKKSQRTIPQRSKSFGPKHHSHFCTYVLVGFLCI